MRTHECVFLLPGVAPYRGVLFGARKPHLKVVLGLCFFGHRALNVFKVPKLPQFFFVLFLCFLVFLAFFLFVFFVLVCVFFIRRKSAL